jgi:inorganic pyrophosphatase
MNLLLDKVRHFEITIYEKRANLNLTHVPFSGNPQRHEHDPTKLVLVSDPFSTNTCYFEFDLDDIDYVEKLPSVATAEGRALSMVRIWVRRQSVAVRCTPFVVENTADRVKYVKCQ